MFCVTRNNGCTSKILPLPQTLTRRPIRRRPAREAAGGQSKPSTVRKRRPAGWSRKGSQSRRGKEEEKTQTTARGRPALRNRRRAERADTAEAGAGRRNGRTGRTARTPGMNLVPHLLSLQSVLGSVPLCPPGPLHSPPTNFSHLSHPHPYLHIGRVIRKVIGSFGVRYFRDSLYAVSLSVTGKYPKFAKIPHP